MTIADKIREAAKLSALSSEKKKMINMNISQVKKHYLLVKVE